MKKHTLLMLALLIASVAQAQIKVGVYGPFTLGSAPMGLSMRDGVRLAADEINAAGGVLGKKIELVERDDESKNEKGSQILNELIDKEGVVAILGPINTGVADASTRVSNEKKVPQIINVATGAKVNDLFPTTPDNYIFGFRANDYIQSDMITREAVDVRKFKKVAIMADATAYGQNGRSLLEKALEKRGLKAVYIGKFNIKDTDMTPQLQEAKNAGAEVVLTYGIGPELAAIATSMNKLGWKVDIIGTWTLSMANFIDNAGANGSGATMPQTFIETNPQTPKQKKFIADFHAKYKVERMPVPSAAAQGYDSMYILKMAIEQAGSTEGPKIKAALENLQKTYEGATGKYDKPYSAKDHEAIDAVNVKMGVVKDGRVQPAAKK
jgi:branched-chain amino acid transport system substrate-binding protein